MVLNSIINKIFLNKSSCNIIVKICIYLFIFFCQFIVYKIYVTMDISNYFKGDVKILQLMGLITMSDIFYFNKRHFNDKIAGFLIFSSAYVGLLPAIFLGWRDAINMSGKDIIIAIELFSITFTVSLGVLKV